MSKITLKPTFELRYINNIPVPFQNGEPYPSFTKSCRDRISLNGIWKKQRFSASHYLSLWDRDDETISLLESEARGRISYEYDDSTWQEHIIPMPENKLPDNDFERPEAYEDGVFYRRNFFIDSKLRGKVIKLNFYGVAYIADIWINGQYVGYHEGGYTPFSFNITRYLSYGKDNIIAVRVDNPPWGIFKNTIPMSYTNDWFNYTGIVRDVYIEIMDTVHIVRTDVIPVNLSGDIKIKTIIMNAGNQSRNIMLIGDISEFNEKAIEEDGLYRNSIGNKVEIQGQISNTLIVRPNEIRAFEYSVRIHNPKLWEYTHPSLYVIHFSIKKDDNIIDEAIEEFGIRTISTVGTRLTINNKAVFLTGVSRHEDWKDSGRTPSWPKICYDFRLIKNSNINFIRTAHYPNDVRTYKYTDRLGLYTEVEIPLWQFNDEHFKIQEERRIADQMWREMVFSNFNSPSIILWSTCNECYPCDRRTSYIERVKKDFKENYNDGRLVSASLDASKFKGCRSDISSANALDILGFTMYFGVMHGSTTYEGTKQFLELVHRYFPDKPILSQEYGMWCTPVNIYWNNCFELTVPETEEGQVMFFNEIFKVFKEKMVVPKQGDLNNEKYLVGCTWWSLCDWYTSHNVPINTLSLMKIDRKSKYKVYYRLKDEYNRIIRGFQK